MEILGNSWNENKKKIRVSGIRVTCSYQCPRVYTCVYVKSFLQTDTKVPREARRKGRGRAWWGVDFRLGDLHGTRISDYMSRIIESRRGNARIIGSPDNRCSNSRCLDN